MPQPRSAPSIAPHIAALIPYSPGKPIEEVKREMGLTDVIKLASNENSLGPSPAAVEAIMASAELVFRYPEGSCHDLRHAMAGHLGIDADHLVFGNGSDELIHYLGLAYLDRGDEVVLGDPTFVQYEAAANLCRATCVKVPLVNWHYDVDGIIAALTPRTRLVFIANPNNPTGSSATQIEIERLLEALPANAILVMDEAYYEYACSPDYPSSLDLVRSGHNVIALRTFSKAYALAGLRIGYGIARPEIVAHIEQVREPFNVSLTAQMAAIAAIGDQDHVHVTLRNNHSGKELFTDAFRRLGLVYTETDANFVWVDVGRDSREVFNDLLRQGVIVRTGDIFGAPTHIRVTIGTPQENERFLGALERVLTT